MGTFSIVRLILFIFLRIIVTMLGTIACIINIDIKTPKNVQLLQNKNKKSRILPFSLILHLLPKITSRLVNKLEFGPNATTRA